MNPYHRYFADNFYDFFPTLEPGYWYGNYDEDKYRKYRFWHNGLGNTLTFGMSGKHIDSSISYGESQSYMKERGISYDDIINPNNLPQYESNYSMGFNFVSDNIRRLYR